MAPSCGRDLFGDLVDHLVGADALRQRLVTEDQAVTQAVVDDAAEIFRAWNPSHSIDVHDALLAASILETGGRLYTQNVKHFPMPELPVTRGW